METEYMKTASVELRTQSGDVLCVSPHGALFSLTLRSIPVLIPVTRGDGKHIQTHFCTPNFGKDHSGVFGLAQHGNMRNTVCDVRSDGSTLTIHHDITDSPDTYPHGISVDINSSFQDAFSVFSITHTHSGDMQAPVNMGVHCYFYAPRSYTHTRINGVDVTDVIENNGNIPLEATNIISIPNQPDILVKQNGFPKAVLWVGQNEAGQKDRTYVCIEPVQFLPQEFNTPQTILQPGQVRHSSLSFGLSGTNRTVTQKGRIT